MLPRIAIAATVLLLCITASAEDKAPSGTAKADEKKQPAPATTKPSSPDEKAIRELLKSLAKALQEGNSTSSRSFRLQGRTSEKWSMR